MFTRITGVLDLVSNSMDWISNKTGGAAPKKKKFKNEGFQESRFIKNVDRFDKKERNIPLMLSMVNLNKTTKELTKNNKSKSGKDLFSTTEYEESKGLSTKSQSQLNNGINSITTGGTQTRNLTVNVEKIIGVENLYSTVDEAKGNIEEKMTESFVKVIQGAEFSLNRG